jgi:tripartite ATP-independent transporter DctM subunit
MLLTLTISLLGFLVLGVPIAFALGLAGLTAILLNGSIPLVVVAQKVYASLDSFPLLAIPLFIYAGSVMNSGGITERIVDFAKSLVGHIRGGLGQVVVLTSLIFAAISGSAAAAAAAVGGMLLPAMKREGYDEPYSVVIVASSAILGPIIPPSILMVIFSSMTGESVGALFLAGIVPGLMIAGVLMLMVYLLAGKMGARAQRRATLGEMWLAFKRAMPALMMPLIIIVGILSGVFTATEAGVVAVAYGIVYGFVTRQLDFATLRKETLAAAITSSSILVILGGAALVSWLLSREGVPAELAALVKAHVESKTMLLFLLLVVLFVVGIFIEPIPAMIMLVPVLLPITNAYGVEPVHFAVIMTVGVLLGSLSPPVAVLVLIAAKAGNVDYSKTNGPLIPMFVALTLTHAVVTFVPQLSTGLVRWLGVGG